MKRKRIFLLGNYFDNGGVNNVNRNIVHELHDKIDYPKCRNKYLRILEMLFKVFNNDVIIFSGISQIAGIAIILCRLLRKKTLFLMHGFLQLEDKENDYSNPIGELNEKLLLKYCDRIYCVSEHYMEFMKSHLPQYADKLDFVTNGIDWNNLKVNISGERDNNKIILIGGGRRTKRNLQVCMAVDKINDADDRHFKVYVYGYPDGIDVEKIKGCKCVTYSNVIPHDELLKVMSSAFLYVQNSDFETFSLGVVEALTNGCNLLISKNVGAQDYIATEENDIIQNNMDIDEIGNKILYIASHPNNKRLLDSINRETSSTKYSANKLYNEALKCLKK